jgi:hypothetical protein
MKARSGQKKSDSFISDYRNDIAAVSAAFARQQTDRAFRMFTERIYPLDAISQSVGLLSRKIGRITVQHHCASRFECFEQKALLVAQFFQGTIVNEVALIDIRNYRYMRARNPGLGQCYVRQVNSEFIYAVNGILRSDGKAERYTGAMIAIARADFG